MNKLKKLREEHNLTQRQIAEILKTSQQNYNRYESGQTPASVETLIKLANFYNVSLDYITGRTPPSYDYGLNKLSDIKRETITKIAQAPDKIVYRVDAYIDVLTNRDLPSVNNKEYADVE